ncbi:class I SAM-dependent methyltransferase, partial [bacterium]|nr:class I SAM-dependent methyltransferase [candidate division CSSED10-310 bacterium]
VTYEREVARDILLPVLDRHGIDLRQRLLEVGAGYGGACLEFTKRGAATVALEYDRDSAVMGAALTGPEGVVFVRGAAEHLPFRDGRFDLVVMHEVVEHLADPEAGLRECLRVLAPGGHLLLTFPPYYSPYGGHVKIRFLLYLPWVHLWLPRRWILRLSESRLSLITERRQRWLMDSENRITLRRFTNILKCLPATVRYHRWYFIRPVFKMRYGAPVVGAGPLARIPLLREILVTGTEYLLRKS